jgi:hypothetical protein
MTSPVDPKLAGALLALSLCLGCQAEPSRPQTGSETHFLSYCGGAQSCGDALECLCGVCTDPCSGVASCGAWSQSATCSPTAADSSDESCGGDERVCEVACGDDADCAPLGGAHRCTQGVCRQLATDCTKGQVAAEDVVLLGDQFMANDHDLTSELEMLARETGALAAAESYRDYSSPLITPFGGATDLTSQYVAAVADGIPRIVIMDVGGPNALGPCADPPTADCPTLEQALNGARALWDQMADDGVEAVVDFFYPDPVDAGLKAKFEQLRPQLQAACEASPVPCHFIDLRTTFAGQSDYLEPAGILPTAMGSAATADAIFAVMQQHCLAQ